MRTSEMNTVALLVSPEKPPTASPAVVFLLPLLLSLTRGPPCQPPWLRREPSVGRAIVWDALASLAGHRSFGPAQLWL